jgi:hypothetical protein
MTAPSAIDPNRALPEKLADVAASVSSLSATVARINPATSGVFHPAEASGYEQLKRRLATEHPNDREAYTGGKSAYTESVMRKAIEWRASPG